MKRFLIFLTISMLVLLGPTMARAAGTCTAAITNLPGEMFYITYSWVGDSSSGSVPATASPSFKGYVFLVITDPGSPSPTDYYDITLTDEDSVDVMGGELADRDETNSEQAVPKIDTVYGARYVTGTLTLNITNQSVASAIGEVKVFVLKP